MKVFFMFENILDCCAECGDGDWKLRKWRLKNGENGRFGKRYANIQICRPTTH